MARFSKRWVILRSARLADRLHGMATFGWPEAKGRRTLWLIAMTAKRGLDWAKMSSLLVVMPWRQTDQLG